MLLSGVVKQYRQNGVASLMLENLINHLTNQDHQVEGDEVDLLGSYLNYLNINSSPVKLFIFMS